MVVEFFEEGHSAPCFYHLASLRTADYGCLVCPKEGLGYRVDVAHLERLVRRMLAAGQGRVGVEVAGALDPSRS